MSFPKPVVAFWVLTLLDNDKVSRLCIPSDLTIREVIARLDAGGQGIVLVTDPNRRLIGTITDGDIRRAILDQVDFNQCIDILLSRKLPRYKNPISALIGTSRHDMARLMRDHVIRQLPIVNADGVVVGLVTSHDLLSEEPPIEAVFSFSESNWQNILLPLRKKPLISKLLDGLRRAGIHNIRISDNLTYASTLSEILSSTSQTNGDDAGHPSKSTSSPMEANGTSLQLIISSPVLTNIDFRSLIHYHQEHAADMTIAVRRSEQSSEDLYLDVVGCRVIDLSRPPTNRFVDAGIYLLGHRARRLAKEFNLHHPQDLAQALLAQNGVVVSFPIREYWARIDSLETYHQVLSDDQRGLIDSIITCEPGTPGPVGTIPLCAPEIRGNEWLYVKECLDTNWVSSVGPYVDAFEAAFARYLGVQHAIAVCNGTSALHIALILAGVRPGDEVLVSSLSFIAPANAIRYVGAIPRFIDCEPTYWQIDVVALERFLDEDCRPDRRTLYNRETGRRIGAILPVHILGHPCDMAPIMRIADRYDIPIIEDATESLGAKYRGQPVGTLGRIGCFSFNGNKLITTGGGGMIVTNDNKVAERARYLTTQAKDDMIEYIHNEVGYNYRLTNLQAAVGCAQLERISEFLEKKRSIAETYRRNLTHIPGISPMVEAPWANHAWWLFTIRVDPVQFGMDSRNLLRSLAAKGIQTRPLWQPLHRSPAHRHVVGDVSLPVAEAIQAEALSLPSSVGLTDHDIERVVESIRDAAQRK